MRAVEFDVDYRLGEYQASHHGELRIPWKEVIAVHRYAPGLLIEMARGAIPIPYRCLSAEELDCFEALAAPLEAHVKQGNG